MTRIRLNAGRSYEGRGISVTWENPFAEVDDDLAEALIASGFFVAAKPCEKAPPKARPPQDRPITIYDTQPLPQLREEAERLGIPTRGVSRARLINALAKATAKPDPEPEEGSLAMIALQDGP